MAYKDLAAVARLELAEVLRSRWLWLCTGLYAALAGALVLVGMRESALLGFSGLGRVLLSVCHLLLGLLPLLALLGTAQTLGRARDEGALELLLSLPIRRGSYLAAVAGTRLLALTIPLVLLFFGLAAFVAIFLREPVAWGQLLGTTAVAVCLSCAFAGVGMAVAAYESSIARALTLALLIWALAIVLLDLALLGSMLRSRLEPRVVFIIAALNPVQAARMALLSQAEPELSVLGPVGFYLANRIGATALFLLGTLWPLALGAAGFLVARRRFVHGDAV